jgi:hypothetical protein
LREQRIGGRVARELDVDRERRILLHARRLRTHADVAAQRRSELGHDLADGGREDVDAANDQHVVRPPDAADPRAGAAAWTRARFHDDVVACAEAQERSGAMA